MLQLNRFDSATADFETRLERLLAFENTQDESVEQSVADIPADVKQRGDAAVLEYTRRFDRVAARSLSELRLEKADLDQAFAALPNARRDALVQAAGRIRSYHERQVSE